MYSEIVIRMEISSFKTGFLFFSETSPFPLFFKGKGWGKVLGKDTKKKAL